MKKEKKFTEKGLKKLKKSKKPPKERKIKPTAAKKVKTKNNIDKPVKSHSTPKRTSQFSKSYTEKPSFEPNKVTVTRKNKGRVAVYNFNFK